MADPERTQNDVKTATDTNLSRNPTPRRFWMGWQKYGGQPLSILPTVYEQMRRNVTAAASNHIWQWQRRLRVANDAAARATRAAAATAARKWLEEERVRNNSALWFIDPAHELLDEYTRIAAEIDPTNFSVDEEGERNRRIVAEGQYHGVDLVPSRNLHPGGRKHTARDHELVNQDLRAIFGDAAVRVANADTGQRIAAHTRGEPPGQPGVLALEVIARVCVAEDSPSDLAFSITRFAKNLIAAGMEVTGRSTLDLLPNDAARVEILARRAHAHRLPRTRATEARQVRTVRAAVRGTGFDP